MENKTVLVVEDETLIARALSKILVKLNYNILGIANDSNNALKLLEQTKPDIILMDIRIDGQLDGIQTAEKIISLYDIPIVYISSLDDEATIDRAKKTQPFGYVIKPFEEKDIKVALEMSLYQYSMEKKLRQSESQYRSVVTSLNDGILLINSELMIETCNPAAELIIGEASDQLINSRIVEKDWKIFDSSGQQIDLFNIFTPEKFNTAVSCSDIIIKFVNCNQQILILSLNLEPIYESCDTSNPIIKSIVCSFKDITIQHNTQEAYRAIVDNSIQGLIVIQDDHIVFANHAVTDILGYKNEVLCNFNLTNFKELIRDEDYDLLELTIRNAESANKKYRHIISIKKANGELTWLEIYFSFFEFKGKIATQLVFIDISDKKAAEQMLIDSEERFRSIFENSYDGIAISDENGNITEWNSAMQKITGLSFDVVNGMKIWEMQSMYSQNSINADRQRMMKHTFDNFFKNGTAPWLDLLMEFNLKKVNGEVITVQQVSFKIVTRKGFILCSMNRDISELMQTRKAQLESEYRLRVAMEAVNDALWDINPVNKEVLYLSPKWFTILGYAADEFIQDYDTFLNFIHIDDRKLLLEKLERISKGKDNSIAIEIRMLARDKHLKWMLFRGKAIETNNDGNVTRLIGTNIDITERKNMEFVLKENEQTILTLLNTPIDPIGLFSLDGKIISMNTAAANMFNQTPEALIGRNYFDYLPSTIVNVRKEQINQVINSAKPLTFIETTENTQKEFSIYPIFNSEKIVSGVAAFSKDLTYIINTQKELAQSEARYRMLFEETPISHWVVDLSDVKSFLDNMKEIGISDFESFIDTLHFDKDNEIISINLIDVNNYTIKLFEAESKEEFKQQFLQLFLSDSFTSLKQLFVKLYEGNNKFEGENIMRTLKGNLIYGYWKFSVAPGFENTWEKVIVSGVDISAKKKVEFALQESEKTLRAILTASPIGIGMVKDRVLLWANEPFFDLLGYKENELKNKSLTMLYQTSEEAGIAGEKLYSQVNESGLGSSELKLLKANGELVQYLVMAKTLDPISPENGQILALMDITERKKSDEQKRNIIRLTMEAEKQKNEAIQIIDKSALLASIGVIAGGITHEINQPLNAIRMGADGILFWNKQNNILPEMMTEMLEGISEAASRIDEIIKHMRSFWIEPNNKEYRDVNLNAAVDKAITLVSQKLQSSEIQLKLFTAEDVLLVKANPVQLELIINNLIINAAHALNETTQKDKWIKINTYQDSQFIYLEISDNGIGLPEVDPLKLFDPFFSTRKPNEGTGLGLAIVKMFADRFDAKISARNMPDAGARFTVFFKHQKTEAIED